MRHMVLLPLLAVRWTVVRHKLRKADERYNGTAAAGPPGPAETHLASFHLVPVAGGHFGEGSAELMDLIKRIARVLSASKWKQLGFKGPKGGIAPAEAGITRRVGLALDRANAQRVARCVSQVEVARSGRWLAMLT